MSNSGSPFKGSDHSASSETSIYENLKSSRESETSSSSSSELEKSYEIPLQEDEEREFFVSHLLESRVNELPCSANVRGTTGTTQLPKEESDLVHQYDEEIEPVKVLTELEKWQNLKMDADFDFFANRIDLACGISADSGYGLPPIPELVHYKPMEFKMDLKKNLAEVPLKSSSPLKKSKSKSEGASDAHVPVKKKCNAPDEVCELPAYNCPSLLNYFNIRDEPLGLMLNEETIPYSSLKKSVPKQEASPNPDNRDPPSQEKFSSVNTNNSQEGKEVLLPVKEIPSLEGHSLSSSGERILSSPDLENLSSSSIKGRDGRVTPRSIVTTAKFHDPKHLNLLGKEPSKPMLEAISTSSDEVILKNKETKCLSSESETLFPSQSENVPIQKNMRASISEHQSSSSLGNKTSEMKKYETSSHVAHDIYISMPSERETVSLSKQLLVLEEEAVFLKDHVVELLLQQDISSLLQKISILKDQASPLTQTQIGSIENELELLKKTYRTLCDTSKSLQNTSMSQQGANSVSPQQQDLKKSSPRFPLPNQHPPRISPRSSSLPKKSPPCPLSFPNSPSLQSVQSTSPHYESSSPSLPPKSPHYHTSTSSSYCTPSSPLPPYKVHDPLPGSTSSSPKIYKDSDSQGRRNNSESSDTLEQAHGYSVGSPSHYETAQNTPNSPSPPKYQKDFTTPAIKDSYPCEDQGHYFTFPSLKGKLSPRRSRTSPHKRVFPVNEPAIKTRYTVNKRFLNHWHGTQPLSTGELRALKEQWSDDWDGLYNPPQWLTADMFAIVLSDIDSNSLRHQKLERAKANLEMAKMTPSSMNMGDVQKVKESDSNLDYSSINDLYTTYIDSVRLNITCLMSSLSATMDVAKDEIEKVGKVIEAASKEFHENLASKFS